MSTKISSSNIQAGALVNFSGPKVTGIAYPADDTAADPAGAQTIILIGSGFEAGLTVYLGGSVVGVSSVVSPTQVTFVAPVKTAGNYSLILVNLDGGTATFVPGIQYSGTPTWSTASGSLATVYETAAISDSLSALSDSAVAYSVESGTLPTGATLFAGNGLVSGTAPVVASSTTYNFTVTAKDGENQDTARNFSYTVNPDAVTWSSPANGATLLGTSGTAYSQVLSAASAAGKSITYTANALPAGLSISGASITGTPSTTSSISTLLTATAATTGRTATRTVTWAVTVPAVPQVAYTTAGTYSWTAPAGVTSVCVVAVGGGGGGGASSTGAGGGGALAYKNNITVTPGQSYSVVVGAGGAYGDTATGGNSSFTTEVVAGGGNSGQQTISRGAGGVVITGTGGGGGAGATGPSGGIGAGGGGAGGYAGTGGAGSLNAPAGSGTGGAGGGGAGGSFGSGGGRGGGGVGILGQGANGAGGLNDGVLGGPGNYYPGNQGKGGSSGTNGTDAGGNYGGGGGYGAGGGGGGAVRILWGAGRAFPSTNTADQ